MNGIAVDIGDVCRRNTRGAPITALRGPAGSAPIPWHHPPTPIDTSISATLCQGKTSAIKQLAPSKLGTVLPDLRRFQTSSTSKTPHSLQSPHDRTSPLADSSPVSLRPPRCRHTPFSAAKSAPTTSVAPSQLHPARSGQRSRSRPAAAIEPPVLTLPPPARHAHARDTLRHVVRHGRWQQEAPGRRHAPA